MKYRNRPFAALEGRSCNITMLWLIGKNGSANIGDLIDARYAASTTVYNAVDALIEAGLVERTIGLSGAKPLKLTSKGKEIYTSCILKVLTYLPDVPDSP